MRDGIAMLKVLGAICLTWILGLGMVFITIKIVMMIYCSIF